MLQINGSHGQDSLFFKHFLSQIEEIEKFPINKDTIVYPKENDKSENSNIDILIINKLLQKCIIIENKIYAGDSNLTSGGQIFRYINHVVDSENIPLENVYVIYLTLDGHAPSPDSLGEKYNNFENILVYSYQDIIIPWLELCLKEVSVKPFLRESIAQYIKLVNKMTGDESSKEERLAYKNLIANSEDNMRSAKALYDNFKHIKWHAVHEFWQKLQNKIEEQPDIELLKPFDRDKKEASITNGCITALTHYEDYRKGQKNKQRCTISFKVNGVVLRVRFSAHTENFYYGIPEVGNESISEELINRLKEFNPLFKQGPNLHLAKPFSNNIKFNNFHNNLAFSIIDPKICDKLVEESWNEVEALVREINQVKNY
jgi:hypothetical protein